MIIEQGHSFKKNITTSIYVHVEKNKKNFVIIEGRTKKNENMFMFNAKDSSDKTILLQLINSTAVFHHKSQST